MIPLLLDIPGQSNRVLEAIAPRLDDSRVAPELLDLETTNVLRRLVSTGRVTERMATIAVSDLIGFRIERYPHSTLMPRVWDLRNSLTSYDAVYLALAESLDATLVTRDTAFVGVETTAEVLLAV